MSADNGIYIAKFPDGFKVAHCQAIENATYYPPNSNERKEMLKMLFGNAITFQTKDEALLHAHEMAEEILNDDFCPILEYGVCYIGEFESFT